MDPSAASLTTGLIRPSARAVTKEKASPSFHQIAIAPVVPHRTVAVAATGITPEVPAADVAERGGAEGFSITGQAVEILEAGGGMRWTSDPQLYREHFSVEAVAEVIKTIQEGRMEHRVAESSFF